MAPPANPNRQRARENGDLYYWGAPCSRGHGTVYAMRYTLNANCVECARAKQRSTGLGRWPRSVVDLDQQAPRAYPVAPQPE